MGGEISAARAHPAVIASIVVAAFALTACALAAIAWMLGWIGPAASPPTPASLASPAGQVAGTAPGVALLPGETLVPDEPESRPATGPKTAEPARKPATGPSPPPPVTHRVAPIPPQFTRDEVSAQSRRPLCVNCGTVESIREVRDAREVRVRFDDGSRRRISSRDERLRPGDRVHLEDGRLVRD